jgi:predicted transglutaminase-like cysteine proteinase
MERSSERLYRVLQTLTYGLLNATRRQKQTDSIQAIVGFDRQSQLYGKADFWTIAETQGDCDDYALAKRKALREAGIPVACLKLATAFVESSKGPGTGGYHCVLLINTDRGTFCLDNRFKIVNNFKKLPYRWALIQAPQGFLWQKIKN